MIHAPPRPLKACLSDAAPIRVQMRDLLLAVRADEACHAHVNHTFSKLKPDQPNPFDKGSHEVM